MNLKNRWTILAGAMWIVSAFANEPELKTMTSQEQADLLEGRGMGLAKAAELNGYPGPRHVLELAEPLRLTTAQLQETRALFDRMRAQARREGAALIDAERALDELYANHRATPALVNRQLAVIEGVRTRLRGVHLQAHLDQAKLLTATQIAEYSRLRGLGHQDH
jgi:Spy/CpxP family protein refolding chaperone